MFLIAWCVVGPVVGGMELESLQEERVQAWLAGRMLAEGEAEEEIGRFVRRRIPPLTAPDSEETWQRDAEALRKAVLEKVVFRGAPRDWVKGEVRVEWLDTLEPGRGYRIRKLRYEALPGLYIPALLYEPVGISDNAPAILNVNGHVYDTGKATEYEQIRCINLAKRGMLALHPEWINCGELRAPEYDHNRLAYLDLCGTSGVAVFYLAMKRALDVLIALPYADPERIAMTGLSGGGWQTIILSALDTRIAAAVPNAGYIGLSERVDFTKDIGDLEQNPTDLVSLADYTHLTALLAPRPALLIYNIKDDCCFESLRARRSVYEPLMPFYELFGKQDGFVFYENIDPGTHNYDRDNREQFYRFINRCFAPASPVDSEIPSQEEVLPPEQLRVGVPETNANFVTLAEDLMRSLPKTTGPERDSPAFARWQNKARTRLRDVLRYKPMDAAASILEEDLWDGLRALRYRLGVGKEWSLPAAVLERAESDPLFTTVLLADGGKSSLAPHTVDLLERGARVVAMDLLLMGECVPKDAGKRAMLVNTVGERPLGIQTSQLAAAVAWACEEFKVKRVSLHAVGANAAVVALAACALHPEQIEEVSLENLPGSLKDLIENQAPFEEHPALFCFGLLEYFDIPTLTALCDPVPVHGTPHTQQ